MQGCGGLCGGAEPATCEDVLARNYAVVSTDMGHAGPPWQALWAYNNLPAEIDFAYRATHVVAVAAKAIVARLLREGAVARLLPRLLHRRAAGPRRGAALPGGLRRHHRRRARVHETGIAALHLIWSGRANLDARAGRSCRPDDVHACCTRPCSRPATRAMASPTASSRIPRRCDWDPEALALRRACAGRAA